MFESVNNLGKIIKNSWLRLWDNPKLVYRALIILLFIGLVYGVWHLGYSITSPFVRKQVASSSVEQGVTDEIAEISKLRAQDTDADGLSDYDELYVFGTSPYLEDTDSDGYSDKTEIDSGHNPNCPAGQKCLLDSETQITGGSDFTLNLPEITDPLSVSNEELRQLLIDNGIDQAILSQISDDDLRQLYEQTINNISLQVGENAVSPNSSDQTSTQADVSFQNLTPAELRQLLLSAGVTEEQINSVSDEELMRLYQESLSSSQ